MAAISQYNPDVLKRHAALALPLAFFAMHEKGNYYTICCSSLLQCRSSMIDMYWLCMYIMEPDKIKWNRIFLLTCIMALTFRCTVMFWLFQIFDSFWLHKNTKPFFFTEIWNGIFTLYPAFKEHLSWIWIDMQNVKRNY